MTSISAWTDMMDQFLGELISTFPEEPAMKKYKTSYEVLRKANPRKCVETYMSTVGQFQDKIMAKDESFFLDNSSNEFLAELNIKKHWTPELSQNTKEAIWQYLHTLYILGTTITMIPKEALDMIENVASDCADSIESSGTMDPKALTGLFSSLGGLLGGGAGGKK